MATLDEQILAWNPWWADAGAIARDPHIRAFEAAPVKWKPPLLEGLPLTPGDAHTVRGPRQAGKTTLTKRLIQRLRSSQRLSSPYHGRGAGGVAAGAPRSVPASELNNG